MHTISGRAEVNRATLRATLRGQFPALCPPVCARIDRDSVVLGRNDCGEPVHVPVRARLEHAHVVGTTGGGKTKFIEHSARQDIIAGRGVCIVDPHGNHPDSLYRSMLSWLNERSFTASRTIHLIDPNVSTHVTGFNPLALPSPEYEPTVIAEAMQEALERMWGEEDMNSKPTMQRVLSATLTALTELKLTLAEARLLFDPDDSLGLRRWAIENLANEEAREELIWLHGIASESRGRHEFRQEVTGPRNRLAKLTRDDAIKLMIGQQTGTLDFRAALDESHIILANLSPGPRAGDKATQLLGRLLTRSILFHSVRRRHPERPFFFYLDECHLYLSGDISRMLAETRKYGTALVLSHQTLAQLRSAGLDILDAVKNTTNLKVVLRIKDPEEAAELADMVLQYDLESPVRSLIKPTIVGHRLVRLNGESESEQFSTTDMLTKAVGTSMTVSSSYSHTEGETLSESVGIAESNAVSASEGVSIAQMSGTGSGAMTADHLTPSGGALFAPSALTGTMQGESAQSHTARSSGSQTAAGRSSGRTVSTQAARAHTIADAWTEGVAQSTSESTAVGRAESRGWGKTNSWSESFEPIMEERPSSVHSLENIRYMAASLLRNLTAGCAAISFVDSSGMKTAALRVARVESYALPPADFDQLRTRVLEASPSATRIEEARTEITGRLHALRQRVKSASQDEPQTPSGFRTKRKRPSIVEPPVDVHGQPSAPERVPVKGRDRQRRRP